MDNSSSLPVFPLMLPPRVPILFLLCLSSFSYSVSLASTCGVIACPFFKSRPPNCVVTPTNPVVQSLRRRRGIRDLGGKNPKIKRTGADVASRGNPICYYISGSAGVAFLSAINSLSTKFILPEGTYVLRWNFLHPEAAFAAARSKFKLADPCSLLAATLLRSVISFSELIPYL